MITQFLVRTIINLGLKNQQKFLRLLAKLEYGVAACLANLVIDAEKSNYPGLAAQLRSHSLEERNHGKMLATLADGKDKIKSKENGAWIYLEEKGIELVNSFNKFDNPSKSKILTGEEYCGIFENLDGISQRYLGLRLFLRGQKVADMSWCDRIACMMVLEQSTLGFYNELASSPVPDNIRLIAMKIAGDEAVHASMLKYSLCHFTHFPELSLDKWRSRLFFAQFGLLWDFWKWTKN
jgi:rubrerythrin